MRRPTFLFTFFPLALAVLLQAIPAPSAAQEAYSLKELLELGREVSPAILAIRAELAALEADKRDAGRFENPELVFETGEGDLFESSETKRVRAFSVSQAIENPIARHYRLKAREYGVEAAGEEVRSGILDVDHAIRLHFYRILYLEEILELARLNEEALEEIRGLIETRARAGEVRELEAIRLRVEHMRAQNRTQAAGLELEQFRAQLNSFLGNNLPEEFQLQGELRADGRVPELDPLVQGALLGHPTLRQATLQREAAAEQLKATRIGWLPSPVLSGSSQKELDGDILTFGIGFQIPLWNQSRAAADRERETVRQMEHQEEDVLLGLRARLLIHHNSLRLSGQTLQLFQEGLLTEAEASMAIAEVSYREGEISFVEYLDARRTYQSIQIEFQKALYDWNRELAELDRAAGGGIL